MTEPSTSRTDARIVPRRPEPAARPTTPRAWLAGDPYRSAAFNGMSLGFPSGEQFFVDSVRAFRSAIDDPELAEAVRAFISQEMHHSRAHDEFNAWVRAGNPVAETLQRKAESDVVEMRKLHPKVQLAITCALEHFTAVLAESLLDDPRALDEIHPDVRALWCWHALEESEHKAVAFDVYQKVCGSYRLRSVVMLTTTGYFLRDIVSYQIDLVRGEGLAPDPISVARSMFALIGPTGPFRPMARRWLDYFRPDFHPHGPDDADRLARARARYEHVRAARRSPEAAAG